MSGAVAAWLEDEGLGARTTVVHNGVQAPGVLPDQAGSRTSLGLPADGVGIGLFGQVIRHKGVRDFVEAAHRAVAEAPGVFFVVAGVADFYFDAPDARTIAVPLPDYWRAYGQTGRDEADMLLLRSSPGTGPESAVAAVRAGSARRQPARSVGTATGCPRAARGSGAAIPPVCMRSGDGGPRCR